MVLSVAKEFTRNPGPRFREDGQWSGRQFLEDVLRPRFELAMESGAKLFVDLDGVAGYPTSFLEEAFGGLARIFAPSLVDKNLVFGCSDEPYLDDEIRRYIREARTAR